MCKDQNIYIFSVKLTESLMETMETPCIGLVLSLTVLGGADQAIAFGVEREKFSVSWVDDVVELSWGDDSRRYNII